MGFKFEDNFKYKVVTSLFLIDWFKYIFLLWKTVKLLLKDLDKKKNLLFLKKRNLIRAKTKFKFWSFLNKNNTVDFYFNFFFKKSFIFWFFFRKLFINNYAVPQR